jgi:hypothetical protein
MKRTFFVLLFSITAIWANAQRGYHHQYNNWQRPQHCEPRIVVAPRFGFGCNNFNRRPFINVVIATRPRVVAYQEPPPPPSQPQIVREWVDAHWEETQNGRVWVEGHYVQREVY